ncbi:MAG: hypothetical protein WC554_10560 [Clostridia bacterium]
MKTEKIIIKKRFKESNLKESSLSKIVSYIQKYDTGTITACRAKYTHKENQQRNYSLEAHLASRAYIIISAKGVYIEDFNTPDATEVKENIFFVVDFKKTGKLKKVLQTYGEKFDQDSILFIPKGGEESLLIGTNHSAKFPGYGKVIKYPVLKLGKNNNEFLTRVNGRPFYFTDKIDSIKESYCGNNSGRFVANEIAKKDWRTLEVK